MNEFNQSTFYSTVLDWFFGGAKISDPNNNFHEGRERGLHTWCTVSTVYTNIIVVVCMRPLLVILFYLPQTEKVFLKVPGTIRTVSIFITIRSSLRVFEQEVFLRHVVQARMSDCHHYECIYILFHFTEE